MSATELERRRKISESKKGKKRPDVAERNRGVAMRTAPRRMSEEGKARVSALRTKHGHARSRPEGRQGTSTYSIWAAMIQRCTNPRNREYKNYGGRGISVCDSWREFKNFLADMGEHPEGLSIDRINNDGNYEPGNCRWATPSQQQRNTRKGHVTPEMIAFVIDHPEMTLQQLSDAIGISKTSASRVRRGERR